MILSELEFIAEDVGLKYSGDKIACLYGNKSGFPMEVYENASREYIIYCHADIPSYQHNMVRDYVKKWESCLPKNTIHSKSVSDGRNGYVRVVVAREQFENEKIIILIEFLEKLPLYLKSKSIGASRSDLEKVSETEIRPSDEKANLTRGENIRITLRGILGGLMGALIGSLIFLILMNVSGYISWFGGVAIGFFTVFFFKKFAKKMSVANTAICGVIVIVAVLYACLMGAAIDIFRSFSSLDPETAPNVFAIFGDMGTYLSNDDVASSNLVTNLLLGYVFALFAGGAFLVWHFTKHPNETLK